MGAFDLREETAIVTGGGSGIGRACALALAEAGAAVAVLDLNEESAQETATLVRSRGRTAQAYRVDVTSVDSVNDAVTRAVSALGMVRYAVNAAGIMGTFAPFPQQTRQAWDQVISINLTGIFTTMQAEVARAVEGASIVNITSGAGLRGAPYMGGYTASKFGVVGLTRSAALDLGPRKIRVNAICPGVIETPMAAQFLGASENGVANPLGRNGQPEEIAQTAVWLCSEASSFVTGQPIAVDGGTNA